MIGLVQLTFAGLTLAALWFVRRLAPRPLTRWWGIGLDVGLILWFYAAAMVVAHTVCNIHGAPQWHKNFSFLGLPAIFASLAIGRWRSWAVASWIVFWSVLGLADLAYFRCFGSIFPIDALANVHMGWDIRSSVVEFIHGQDAWLLPTAIAAIAMPFALPYSPPLQLVRDRWRMATVAVVLIVNCIVAYQWRPHVSRYLKHRSSWKVFTTETYFKTHGFYGSHGVNIARTLREWWLQSAPGSEELDAARTHFFSRATPDPDQAEDFGLSTGANVLIVQLEGMQQWLVGARALGQEITPFMNSLHKRGYYFENILDQTGSSPTADCEYNVLASQHTLRRGAVVFRRPNNDFLALPEILHSAGYSTLSAHPWKRGFWNRAVVHPRFGFERSLFRRELGEGEKLGWGMSDESFFDRMAPEIKELKQPFFAFMVTLTTHHPYKAFAHRGMEVGVLRNTTMGQYIRGANYLDNALRKFVESLDHDGLLENTILVVYGDHDGKLRYDASFAKRAATVIDVSEQELTWIGADDPRTDFIPLFVLLPAKYERNGVRQEIGGQVDVAPTLLHFLGIEKPQSLSGRPLLNSSDRVTVRHDGVALNGSHIFIPRIRDRDCFSFSRAVMSSSAAEPAECTPLLESRNPELQYSWMVTEHDLATELAATK